MPAQPERADGDPGYCASGQVPEAVEKAGIGQAPALPAHLADLFEREERCTVLPNELAKVQAFVSQHGNRGKPL